ncbi:MAG: hypothetical protein ACREEW_18115 [Caulobacteraceae bacterium]
MSVIGEVLAELWSMFVGDRRLTFLTLAVVVAAALIAAFVPAMRLVATWVLLAGAVLVLADSVFQAARKAKRA